MLESVQTHLRCQTERLIVLAHLLSLCWLVDVLDSYVMKLFDRSVDLAQFSHDTPLYPVCRAWIRNLSQLPPTTEQPASNEPPDETQVHSLLIEQDMSVVYLVEWEIR